MDIHDSGRAVTGLLAGALPVFAADAPTGAATLPVSNAEHASHAATQGTRTSC